jgi:hypothetical protein
VNANHFTKDGEMIRMDSIMVGKTSGKTGRFVGLVIVACMCVLCASAAAQDQPAAEEEEQFQPLTWGLESDYNPRYVWRGLAWTQGAVTQTSLWATAGGTTYSIWANSNMESVDGRQTDEVDYAVSRECAWRNVTIEPMLQVYTYPHQQDAPSTAEADLKFSWPLGPLTAFTTHTLDVHEYRGAYFGDVGLSWQRELGKHAEFETSVSLGWASAKFNETYIGPAKSALNVGSFDLSLTWHARGATYIRPHLGITRILNGELRDAVQDPSIVNLGLAIGTEF